MSRPLQAPAPHRTPYLRGLQLALLSLIVCACTGGVREIKGEAPLVSLGRLELQAERLTLDLAIRNLNDQSFELSAVSLKVLLDEDPLARGRHEIPLHVSARGREVLHLPMTATRAGLERLEQLAAGEVQQLPWSLEATLFFVDAREHKTMTTGWLHRVPGQPGRFR